MGQPPASLVKRTYQDSCRCLVSIKRLNSSLLSTHILFSATALQSVEIACDTLLSGKAKVMLAGGFDDLSEEGSYEFANMKATSNAETEFAMGREPTEMSRPATTTRSGVRDPSLFSSLLVLTHLLQFMEAQGTGVHVLMSAKTALELGCPIRGIIGFTSTST